MRTHSKKGFTLSELMVVLAIMAVIAAIAIPTAIHYINLAEFRKNESNAKTVYLAAEAELTWYRTSGQWERFKKDVVKKGTLNDSFDETEYEHLKGRKVYAITWDSKKGAAAGASPSGELVEDILEDNVYDKDFFNAAITIEIDADTGQVYSAFYATRCDSLSYTGTDEKDAGGVKVLDISAKEKDGVQNRAYESRRKRFLGYYSVEDVTNVVDMKPVRLKVGSINLINSETLSLNWSSTSRHDNLDVEFTVAFYQKNQQEEGKPGDAKDKKLFTLTVNRDTLKKEQGWTGSSGQMALLELKKAEDEEEPGGGAGGPEQPVQEWAFPLAYQKAGSGQSARFSLVLDGMMSPELMESLEANQSKKEYVRQYSTNITRLASVVPELAEPQDIYAVVEVKPTYKNMSGDSREYRASSPVKSNVENSMFSKGTEEKDGKLQAKVTRFRHLSNIRYYDAEKDAEFTLSARNMDWTSNSTGLYDLAEEKKDSADPDGDGAGSGSTGGTHIMTVQWKNVKTADPDAAQEAVLDFPSIPLLSEKHTLKGSRDRTLVSNLHLGNGSMADDADIEKLYKEKPHRDAYAQYLGLFCESEGTIQEVTLRSPRLSLTGEGEAPAADYAHLRGVGILCGRSEGTLQDIAVDPAADEDDTVTVRLADRTAGGGDAQPLDPAGIGGVAGVLAKKNTDGTLAPQDAGEVIRVTMEGSVSGKLPKPEGAQRAGAKPDLEAPQREAAAYPYGIGGIFGYASLGENVTVEECQNRASVTGNLFTGGIGGRVDGKYASGNTAHTAELKGCYNDGLVLCGEKYGHPDDACELEGRYFGGILGYGAQTHIQASSSASGRAKDYRYLAETDQGFLLGQYVGGIIGYGNTCLVSACSTQKDGYILGSDYVGGIAGGLTNNIKEVITGSGEIRVTTNAGYVIGNRYVGGIVGKNNGNGTSTVSTIKDCVNNGIAAGYGRYIGGIVGYNGKYGELANCSSYYSDYGNAVLGTIVGDWKATTGDCAGGLAGYNNGTIRFEADAAAAVKSVSSVVVGRDYVGGMVGFNDKDGKFLINDEKQNMNYSLIGGQVYAQGDGVGGCIGLNASVDVLKQNLEIRPSGVSGRYCVGGFIGANVVDLDSEVEDVYMSDIRINNVLGSVSGTAFTGGVIGYQRTYQESQLQGNPDSEDETVLLAQLMQKREAAPGNARLLPELTEGNLPATVVPSRSSKRLVIENRSNTQNKNLDSANSNIPVVADLYAGGIVGYCERSSKLVLRDCRNDGNITKKTAVGDGSDTATKVYLKAYLEHLASENASAGFQNAAAEIGKEEQGSQPIYVSMVGGVTGSNLENQVIDHCANKGGMSGFVGLGGIVGLNAGGVFDCELQDNFGNTSLDFIGGIAGLNVKGDEVPRTYAGNYNPETYTSGTIAGCTTVSDRTVFGRSYVGGIAGYNLAGGKLEKNQNQINVMAVGDYAGGIAGANSGTIQMSGDTSSSARTVNGPQGAGIGGIVGWNKPSGEVSVTAPTGGTGTSRPDEVIAVGSKVSIDGRLKVGGIAGINEGRLGIAESQSSGTTPRPNFYLTCQAQIVRAREGYAGGIAGESGKKSEQTESGPEGAGDAEGASGDAQEEGAPDSSARASAGQGNIENARNKSENVTADVGPAGGIVAVNQKDVTLKQCQNRGNVNSDHGYAGGIAAENYGLIQKCSVGKAAAGTAPKNITISSRGADEIGEICAVNRKGAVIQNSLLLENVTISGSAKTVGGIAGANQGTIEDVAELADGGAKESFHMPAIRVSSSELSVGGAAGRNEGGALIRNLEMKGLKFEDFTNYQYLGGIVGINQKDEDGGSGLVSGCAYIDGAIEQKSGGSAGNCYGGIAGKNEGDLRDCKVQQITVNVQGVYTATSTNTAEEKEDRSSHVGGIAGKNEEDAKITGCLIHGGGNDIRVSNGMAGGIVGYNKGNVEKSGDEETIAAIRNDGSIQDLTSHSGFQADTDYVWWKDEDELEKLKYNGTWTEVSANRSLSLIVETNGNVGGITAYNAPTGAVATCATGNWYLNNKSEAIGVGTGGIIGMNESENDLSLLLNRAFVGRQLKSGATDRFAGGIIGNQNNTTAGGWKIANCANYGTVYCMNTHYSGGIIGQWTGTGGNIEKCYNYGNLQTTIEWGWVGASGGIVAQLYHAYEGNEYNIISCKNYGSLYGRAGSSIDDCANDSAGILGNVTAYTASGSNGGQGFTIQVLDCVNGSGVEIYSNSMASGIVGFFSCDSIPPKADNKVAYPPIEASTRNIKLRIERCRNFASVLRGRHFVGGIFGERYGEIGSGKDNTVLQDCYSVDLHSSNGYASGDPPKSPIISYANGENGGKYKLLDSQRNYFFEAASYNLGNTTIDKNLVETNTNRAYYYNNGANRYALYIEPNKNASKISIDESGNVKNDNNGTVIGKVLFEIKEDFANMAQVVAKTRNFDQYVRTAYYKIEGVEPDGKIPNPIVTLARLSGSGGEKALITVTPPSGTKPFRYTAKLYVDGKAVSGNKYDLEFYSNTYSIDLSRYPQAQTGQLTVQLRAWSMFDDVDPSDLIMSGAASGQKMLPNPDIRMELEKGEKGYQYRISLKEDNKKKFEELKAADGSAFTDYKISVKFMDGTKSVDLTPGNKLEAVTEIKNDSLQQLLVQAEPGNAATSLYAPSSQVSVPVYLPAYKPSIQIGNRDTGTAVPSFSFTGTSVADLAVTVELNAAGSGKITTPPIYRADLVGTWTGGGAQNGKEVVLASTDILTAADASAKATFSDLPKGVEHARDLKVRVWYAQSGLGPVYTWHDLKEAAGSNFCTLKEMKEENGVETPVWEYGYSAVLADKDVYGNYQWESRKLFEWIGPPELKDAGSQLKPIENAGKLQYEFSWDCKDSALTPHDHIVTLKGITRDADGNENQVSIKTEETVAASAGNKYTVDAEDWNYTEVELTVACKGDASKSQIGLSSTGRYLVKQRLPRPEQPSVTNQDVDELNYTIEWLPVSPETSAAKPDTGCISYDICAEKYEDGKWVKVTNPADSGLPEGVVKNVTVNEKKQDGRYGTLCNLEQYTEGNETKLRIYLVAKAGPDDAQYTDSLDGAATELTIPARITPPDVTWEKTWTYDRNQPVTADGFQAVDPRVPGSLNVTVRPKAGSAQTGDSSYLLKAYVLDKTAFDTAPGSDADVSAIRAEVKAALESGDAQKLADLGIADITYPAKDAAGGTLSPVVMEVNGDAYSHTLRGLSAEHAGKWILFYTRMSSGNGQLSSKWVSNGEVWRLPYVKLTRPTVNQGMQERAVKVINKENPDVPVEESWTASQTVLQWDDAELPDAYEITLTGAGGNQDYRVEESTEPAADGTGEQKKVTVYHKTHDPDGTTIVWEEVEQVSDPTPGPGDGSGAQQRTFTFILPGHQAALDSSYEDGRTIDYHMEMETMLEVQWVKDAGFSYTLILPDADSFKTEKGTEVQNPVRTTSKADVWANVKENSPEGKQPQTQSEAYVRSDPSTKDFSNQ